MKTLTLSAQKQAELREKLNEKTLTKTDIIPMAFLMAGHKRPAKHGWRHTVIESAFAAPRREELESQFSFFPRLSHMALYDWEQLNLLYARKAMADCIGHGEVPHASHTKYTQPHVLRDSDPHERALGLAETFTADQTAVYWQRGLSEGMVTGIKLAVALERQVVIRTIPRWDSHHRFNMRSNLDVVLNGLVMPKNNPDINAATSLKEFVYSAGNLVSEDETRDRVATLTKNMREIREEIAATLGG